MKSKPLVFVLLLVTIAAVLGGIWFDRQRAEKRRATAAAAPKAVRQTPPLPQWGELLPSSENMEVTGSAMCGWCTWGVGEAPDNIVLQTATEPGIVFLLPNEKLSELEKLTHKCAGGDYWVTARGTVTLYEGHNYMLVQNFEALKTK
ncbi:MAG: hypothetical protein ABIR71_11805 [Chthoniobacterales bacterium]